MQIPAHHQAGFRRDQREIFGRPVAREVSDAAREHQLAQIRAQRHMRICAQPVECLNGLVHKQLVHDRRFQGQHHSNHVYLCPHQRFSRLDRIEVAHLCPTQVDADGSCQFARVLVCSAARNAERQSLTFAKLAWLIRSWNARE